MSQTNFSQTVSLHKMWRTLDINQITELVSDNIIYESSWGVLPIVGKKNFLSFMTTKLETIRNGVERDEIQIQSHVIQIEGMEGRYFIHLNYIINEIECNTLLRVTGNNGLIERIEITPYNEDWIITPVTVLND